MDNTNNMNNTNNFNNQNNMNYNANQQQQIMPQQGQQENNQNTFLGVCPRCGQKLSNPKYCMHCGTQTDVLINQQINHKKELLEKEKQEIGKKVNTYSNIYYIFFAIEVIGMIVLYKYFISEIMVLGFSVIFGGEMNALHVIVIILPIVVVIAYLIVCVKTLIYSLGYLKFGVTIKGILTIIISFMGLSSMIFGLASLALA